MTIYFKVVIFILKIIKIILEWHCKKCINKAKKIVERFRESEGK